MSTGEERPRGEGAEECHIEVTGPYRVDQCKIDRPLGPFPTARTIQSAFPRSNSHTRTPDSTQKNNNNKT